MCSNSEQKINLLSKLQLPNLLQTVANTFLIININNAISGIYEPLEIGCRGVIDKRNALILETICNLVGIKAQQKLKGTLSRIALLGSYRIFLARRSPEWSGGELISVS